ncbi:hypothetical protein BS78_02G127700 [Paspalum vaginatum]|nr:hypothetical protein BS78_02G127700 [Paspalum vaginatum]
MLLKPSCLICIGAGTGALNRTINGATCKVLGLRGCQLRQVLICNALQWRQHICGLCSIFFSVQVVRPLVPLLKPHCRCSVSKSPAAHLTLPLLQVFTTMDEGQHETAASHLCLCRFRDNNIAGWVNC